LICYVFVVKTLYDRLPVVVFRRSTVFCMLYIMLMASGIMFLTQKSLKLCWRSGHNILYDTVVLGRAYP